MKRSGSLNEVLEQCLNSNSEMQQQQQQPTNQQQLKRKSDGVVAGVTGTSNGNSAKRSLTAASAVPGTAASNYHHHKDEILETLDTPVKKSARKTTETCHGRSQQQQHHHVENNNILCNLAATASLEQFAEEMGTIKFVATERRGTGFSKTITNTLRTWFKQHISHPYPSIAEKAQLAQITGLTKQQVTCWFLNARKRSLKSKKSDLDWSKYNDKKKAEEKEIVANNAHQHHHQQHRHGGQQKFQNNNNNSASVSPTCSPPMAEEVTPRQAAELNGNGTGALGNNNNNNHTLSSLFSSRIPQIMIPNTDAMGNWSMQPQATPPPQQQQVCGLSFPSCALIGGTPNGTNAVSSGGSPYHHQLAQLHAAAFPNAHHYYQQPVSPLSPSTPSQAFAYFMPRFAPPLASPYSSFQHPGWIDIRDTTLSAQHTPSSTTQSHPQLILSPSGSF